MRSASGGSGTDSPGGHTPHSSGTLGPPTLPSPMPNLVAKDQRPQTPPTPEIPHQGIPQPQTPWPQDSTHCPEVLVSSSPDLALLNLLVGAA